MTRSDDSEPVIAKDPGTRRIVIGGVTIRGRPGHVNLSRSRGQAREVRVKIRVAYLVSGGAGPEDMCRALATFRRAAEMTGILAGNAQN